MVFKEHWREQRFIVRLTEVRWGWKLDLSYIRAIQKCPSKVWNIPTAITRFSTCRKDLDGMRLRSIRVNASFVIFSKPGEKFVWGFWFWNVNWTGCYSDILDNEVYVRFWASWSKCFSTLNSVCLLNVWCIGFIFYGAARLSEIKYHEPHQEAVWAFGCLLELFVKVFVTCLLRLFAQGFPYPCYEIHNYEIHNYSRQLVAKCGMNSFFLFPFILTDENWKFHT